MARDTKIIARRASERDATFVEAAWMALMAEEAALDDRFRPAADARERWRSDFPLWLRDPAQLLLVGEVRGAAAGFLSARLWGPAPIFEPAGEVFIEFLYVAPEFRRSGVGRLLVARATDWAGRQGAEKVRVKMLSQSDDAVGFWQAVGASSFAVEMTLKVERPRERPARRRIGFRGNSP